MFGANFGTPKMQSKNEQEKAPFSLPWKKFFTILLAGGITLNATAGDLLSLSPENKKGAIEFMKQSPEKVRACEAKIIEQAKSLPIQIGSPADKIEAKYYKTINFDSSMVIIDYADQKGDSVIGIHTSILEPNGAYYEVFDGYHGAPMDGRADAILAGNKAPGTQNSFDLDIIKFTDKKDKDGKITVEVAVESEGLQDYLSQYGGHNTMYVNAQSMLDDLLGSASK